MYVIVFLKLGLCAASTRSFHTQILAYTHGFFIGILWVQTPKMNALLL